MISFKLMDDFCNSFQTWHFEVSNIITQVKKLRVANQCGSRSETLLLSLRISGFAIFGPGHQGNLRICDLQFNHNKFADLRLRNQYKICGFAIYGITKKCACPSLCLRRLLSINLFTSQFVRFQYTSSGGQTSCLLHS